VTADSLGNVIEVHQNDWSEGWYMVGQMSGAVVYWGTSIQFSNTPGGALGDNGRQWQNNTRICRP
jgi:hypothetical protein